MKKFDLNKVAAGVGLVAAVVSQGQAIAETVPSTASVTVQNTFTLAQVQALTFGTIRAVADPAGTQLGSIVVSPNPAIAQTASTNGTNASAQVITAGSAGQFSVTGAAPF
ncbi:hypothetical protein, partial [Rheinheimera sp.]|uniref:hypothetical protein n=1 Tax=Rheinheimera sp. TaxID=1869214 RepID=UPI002605BFEF